MTKEKLAKLEKYRNELVAKLASGTPAKHTNHAQTYANFLKNELDAVVSKIEAAKLVEDKK